MDDDNSAVLLFSGGLDSTVILYDLLEKGHEVSALLINYGQKHNVELRRAEQILNELGTPSFLYDIDWRVFRMQPIEKNLSMVHPFRNVMFLTIAAAWAVCKNIHDIYIGANADDQAEFPDCRRLVFDNFEKVLTDSLEYPIKIRTPLINMTKQEIYNLGRKLNVPIEKIWYCYQPQVDEKNEYKPCGTCRSCKLMNRFTST